MNIQVTYLYRDAANYKKWGDVIFSNPQELGIGELETKLRSILIDQTWFYASTAKVADLHFEQFDPEIDHDWHELDSQPSHSPSGFAVSPLL